MPVSFWNNFTRPAQKIKTLSQGQQAKIGLLTALAYRPELLILDEPSSGLDPVVRRDILEAIFARCRKKGGRFCSRRICWMKSSAWPITW